MDLGLLLVSLYVTIDDWWEVKRPAVLHVPGRPVLLSESEVLTLAVLTQWPRWRSERDFWRFADAHLRSYFPNQLSQSQLNRRIRALEPDLRALQRHLSGTLADGAEVYRMLDTTLVPAIVRVRACRKGLFAGQASFGRSVSKTEWVYGFKVALALEGFGRDKGGHPRSQIGDAGGGRARPKRRRGIRIGDTRDPLGAAARKLRERGLVELPVRSLSGSIGPPAT